jgi:peptidoglycan/xylan/chitin deacetylase (PgdA/CDA1 family)
MSHVAILMYHGVSTGGADELTVDPSLFDEHVAALRGAGVRLVTVDQVPGVLAEAERELTAAITIDDGLADVASGALPALTRHRAQATLFVPTSFVGGTAAWLRGDDARRPMLSWSALAEIAAAGHEIGSHGHRHLACDVNHRDLVRSDACDSRAMLEDRLGRPVRSFGFPFGYAPSSAREAIRAAGFVQACAVAGLPAASGDDRFALPRLHVGPRTTPAALLEMVQRRPASPTRWWANAKQRVWTVGRRHAGWGPPEAGVVTTLPSAADR